MKIRFGMIAGLLLVGPSTAMASQRECPEGMFSFGFTECAQLGSLYSRYGWGQPGFLKFAGFAAEDFITGDARTPNGKNDPPGTAFGLEKHGLKSDNEVGDDNTESGPIFVSWFDLENTNSGSGTQKTGDGSNAFSGSGSASDGVGAEFAVARWEVPVTTNPEPASVILLATGLATVAGVVRRRRNSSAS